MLRDVLFRPFINVDVDNAGHVVDVTIDWSDTCQGEFIVDELIHDNDTPAAHAACELFDRPEVRQAMLDALKRFI